MMSPRLAAYTDVSWQILTSNVLCGLVLPSGTNFSGSIRTSESHHLTCLALVFQQPAIPPREEHVDGLTALPTRVSERRNAPPGGQTTTSYHLVEYSTHPRGASEIFPTPPLQHPAGRPDPSTMLPPRKSHRKWYLDHRGGI